MPIFLNILNKALIFITVIQLILLIYFQLPSVGLNWQKDLGDNTLYTTSNLQEKFNPNLSYINTISKLEKYFFSEIERNKLQDRQIVSFADNLIRERFSHHDYFIQPKDNWVLHVFNSFTRHRNNSTLLSSVNPNYIIKFNGAICNQQSLIFQHLMKASDIEYQSVLFNVPRSPEPFGHFASAAKIDNQWIFVDTNLEPEYDYGNTQILDALLSGDVDLFNLLYPNHKIEELPKGSISVDYKNKNPAFFGRIFQDILYFISWYGWVASLICYFLINRFKRSLKI
jgi:hypothetical protein